MEDIQYTQLIITCEACGNVKRFTIASQDECERIFREFHCENSCGRNLYSFITLGTLHRELELAEQSVEETLPEETAPPTTALAESLPAANVKAASEEAKTNE
jgi:hypothetical protein